MGGGPGWPRLATDSEWSPGTEDRCLFQPPAASSRLPLLFVWVFCVVWSVVCAAAAACAGKNWAKVFLVQAEPSWAGLSK